MKKFYGVIASLIITSTLSSIAFGDMVLRSGETVFVTGSQYVTCSGGYNPGPMPPPQPMPPPPPPPPPQRFRVMVRPNYSCLHAIANTDGRSLAAAALRCDNNNPEKRNVRGRQCNKIRSEVDHGCASTVLNKKTTVIHWDQEQTVQNACTTHVFMCE